MDYLHSSTEALNMAIEAIAPNHPKPAQWLHNLGVQHYTRYKQTGTMDDINYAVKVIGLAVDAMPFSLIELSIYIILNNAWALNITKRVQQMILIILLNFLL